VLPHLAAFLLAALSPIDSAPVSSAPDLKNRVGDFFSCSSDQVVSHAPATPVNTGENRLYGYENASGIPHYRARYYDPELGRFISEDPIHFDSGDYNILRAFINNPSGLTDPTGMSPLFQYGSNAVRVYYNESVEFKVLKAWTGASFLVITNAIAFSQVNRMTYKEDCYAAAKTIFAAYSAYNVSFFFAMTAIGPTRPLAAARIIGIRFSAQAGVTYNYWKALNRCDRKPSK